ncbi:MAG: hypothetical protein KAR87_01605 [Candidatus Aenigmarchaeota archaeon]|nr:hypothetical protein [Candidatus Aenigmarchaeota archaeon]
MLTKKAQSAVELVVMFCMLSLIFTVFVTNIIYKNANLKIQKVNQNSRYISDWVSTELNNVYIQGYGYSRNFTLPVDIIGYNYSIRIVDHMVLVFVANNNTYLRKTIPENISGELKKGLNCVTNKNGVIYVTH